MMKRFLLASTLLASASPVLATEYVVDTTFDNTSNLTLGTGCSYGTGELIASSALGRCARKSVAVKDGDHIKYTVTIRNYSAGAIQVVAGAPTPTATGADIAVTDGTNGSTAIADNFTSDLGLAATVETHPADDSTETVGAFRFSCSAMPKFIADDPMVYHGQKGGSHPHMVVGNMGFNANSTERSLRISGASNCGLNGRRYPVQRSAYWMPALENGYGDMQVPFFQNFYYKRLPNTNAACGFPDTTHVGYCIPLPRSLRYLMGFNMATMSGGPTAGGAEGANFSFECRQRANQGVRNTTANGSYTTIDAVVAAGCPAGDILYVAMNGMPCWTGNKIDTINHRDHMAWPTGANVSISWTSNGVAQTPGSQPACPTTHPYLIPTFAWQAFFITDASFAAGKWHFSSDDGMGMANGTTLHMDYWASWSPYFQNLWNNNCLDGHRTCSGGTDGVSKSFGGSPGTTGDLAKPISVSIGTLGRSRRLEGNGTYTGEITAAGDGQIYLYAPTSFTGRVDDWSMTTVTKVNKATITTHHTTH